MEQKRKRKGGGVKGGKGGRGMDREKGEKKEEGIVLMLTPIICGNDIVNPIYFLEMEELLFPFWVDSFCEL